MRLMNVACASSIVALLGGCAHRTTTVGRAELERAALEIHGRGSAKVRTNEGAITELHRDETVQSPSGPVRAGFWISRNCEPSGACHFDDDGITIERVDARASIVRTARVGGALAIAAAVTGGVTCGAGIICDSDTSRTVGAVTLGGVGAALAVGIVMLGTCKSCWAVK